MSNEQFENLLLMLVDRGNLTFDQMTQYLDLRDRMVQAWSSKEINRESFQSMIEGMFTEASVIVGNQEDFDPYGTNYLEEE